MNNKEPEKVLKYIKIKQRKSNSGHIGSLQHITLAFDLTWKDIMVIFSQTFSDPEYAGVLKEAWRYARGLHRSSDKYPVGETAVPSSGPNWNYNNI